MMDADNLDPRLRDPDDPLPSGIKQSESAAATPAPSAKVASATISSAHNSNSIATTAITAAPVPPAGSAESDPAACAVDGAQALSQLQQGHPTPASSATAPTPSTLYYPATPSTTVGSPAQKSAALNHQFRQIAQPNALHQAPATPQQHGSVAQVQGVIPHADVGGTPVSNDPKRSRACEACRGLKVRCEPTDPLNPDAAGPCKRCAKAGRQCIVTAPTRKRQKKADSRVAELEKKIDALTASLHARASGAPSSTHPSINTSGDIAVGGASQPGSYSAPNPALSTWAAQQTPAATSTEQEKGAVFMSPLMVVAGVKRKLQDSTAGDGADTEGNDAAGATQAQPNSNYSVAHDYADIIDRGVMSMETAIELFDRFVNRMLPHLPAVVFPPGTTAGDVRKTKPTLFLAIMASAASEIPQVQKLLIKELMQIFAEKIIVSGEKYLELIQALHIAVIWYYPPDHFEELKFYQLVHISAVMAIDIGLGHKRPNKLRRRGSLYSWRDHPYRKHPFPDPASLECRRTWLTCYFLASNTSMSLHRPNLVRWTPFMDESMEILQSSPEAASTDQYFCHLVWTHKLAEEVGTTFSMDDISTTVNIADSKTQYSLRGFERELEKYSNSIPPKLHQPSLKLSFHVLSLYMHEIALHNDKDECARQYSTKDALATETYIDNVLTPQHINALSACLTAIDGIFDTFLSMDISSIRCLPVFNFVRVAYAVVVLIKMYFAASAPNSELGKVIDKDHMKVEAHLDALLEKFRSTAAEDRSRPATKFLVVLVMLRSWFQNKGKFGIAPPSCPAADGVAVSFPGGPQRNEGQPQQQGQGQQQGEYSATANTPLQLLSEVATNANDPSRAQQPGQAQAQGVVPSSGTGAQQNGAASGFWQPFYDTTGPTTTSTADVSGSMTAGGDPLAFASQPTNQLAALANANLVLDGQSAMPWVTQAFNPEFDYYSNLLEDGFEQAMGLTLGFDVQGAFGGMGAGTMSLQGLDFNGMPLGQIPGMTAAGTGSLGMKGDGNNVPTGTSARFGP